MSLSRDELRKKFQEEYDRLNEKQKEAVDHIEGPVMVIAGPGTGKTQILASRIGRILLDTDTAPENILCLTYTDAGAIAMRRRLLNFIGPDAYKVSISTFHAFCHEVIQANLHLFEKNTMEPMSELQQVELFKRLIDSFPRDHALKRIRDPYYERPYLAKLFSAMKREGWKPAFLQDRIKAYVDDLPNREAFQYKRAYKGKKAGDLKEADYNDEVERMGKLAAAVGEFDKFQKMMRDENIYDFDDMINWVIDAFANNPTLKARYQERFLYILVDEYQDTSGTQNRIVELLTDYWDQPNIFVVGDDDQSIYRFQGANIENMSGIADKYRDDLFKVVLPFNYRSTQPILDLAGQLIANNGERLIHKFPGLTKDLVAGREELKKLTHTPLIHEYDTPHQEMIGITEEVRKLIAAETSPGRIAVLYKENKYGEELATYLRLQKIPAYSRRSLDLLKIPLVRKILLVMRWLNDELDIPFSGDERLFEILHFDWFHVPALQVAQLANEAADRQRGSNIKHLRELLAEKIAIPSKDLFTPSMPEPLRVAGEFLEGLVNAVPNHTLQQLFEILIRNGGVVTTILAEPDGTWQLQVLTRLFDFVKDETRRDPDLNLRQFIELLDLMEQEEVSLPMAQVTGSEQGVNLLTTHGSKGLEFEHVFLAGCNADYWEGKRKNKQEYKLPDTVFSTTSDSGSEEELRRLFYVAVTRAERHLYISYAKYKNEGKEMEPTRFIAEVMEGGKAVRSHMVLSEEVLTQYRTLQFLDTGAPMIDDPQADFITRALEKFEMSVTALSNYLRCPLEFYYNNIVRIPGAKNEAMVFGTAVHAALQLLFENMRKDPALAFPPKAEFLSYFERHMYRHREGFTQEEYKRRLEYGQDVLSKYYDTHIPTAHKDVELETFLGKVVVNGVPIRGMIDKYERHPDGVKVVDYKTGKVENGEKKLKGPNDKDPNGGDYWRQAVFYKLLLENSPRRQQVRSVEFDFIEPDTKKNYRKLPVHITPPDEETVRQQIRNAWERIQDRDFFTGCGKPDCHWCNFVKEHKIVTGWKEEEVEPD